MIEILLLCMHFTAQGFVVLGWMRWNLYRHETIVTITRMLVLSMHGALEFFFGLGRERMGDLLELSRAMLFAGACIWPSLQHDFLALEGVEVEWMWGVWWWLDVVRLK